MSAVGDTLKRDPRTALRVCAVSHRAHASACGPRGFTLIEIMVALTLSALVVLLAHRVFTGVVDATGRLRDARLALDREANGLRFLQEALGSLDVGTQGAGGFAGRPERVEFATWHRVPHGWLERGRLTLGLEDGRFMGQDSVARVEFDYLLEAGANAAWVREWISPVSAPVAVRIRITGRGTGEERVDTVLVLVGPRG